MAQKAKTAAKESPKAKARAAKPSVKKKTVPKKTTTRAPTKSAAKAGPAARSTAKATSKPKPSAQSPSSSLAKSSPPTTPKVATDHGVAKIKSDAATVVAAPPTTPRSAAGSQIARAKSALKRQKPGATAKPPGGAKAERARARKLTIEISANEAASALAAKWSSLFKRSEQIDAKPYSMTSVFEERTAIVHKVLGWGYILANRNDRLEVLFKDGIKYLISNYKP